MFAQYIKQAWQLLKQNRFYSAIYILATGFSISLIMVLAIVIYMKIANVYPETRRDRLLVISGAQVIRQDKTRSQSGLSLETIEKCVYPLRSAAAVSAVYGAGGKNFVIPDNSPTNIPVTVKYVDTGFWDVFQFKYVNGKPFTEADMESGIPTLVVCESLAHKLFGTHEAMGKYINLNFKPYRICGVVKDVSYIAKNTFAHLWMPYTAYPGFAPFPQNNNHSNTLGSFTGYVLGNKMKDVDKIDEEIKDNVNRYNSSLSEVDFSIDGPDLQWQSVFRLKRGQTDREYIRLFLQYGLIFFILLLIPAISLSGITESQIERRLSEMGVRRAFGAPVGSLMKQLIAENLLFTFLGGLLGLLFSYIIVYSLRRWIIDINIGGSFFRLIPEEIDISISLPMFMNFTVFFVALLVCLILNLMTTVVPAWQASRREIVYSLNSK